MVSRCGPRVERRPLIACSHTPFAPLLSLSSSTLAPTSVIFLPFCILHFFPAIFFSLSLLLFHLERVHFLRIYYSSSSSGHESSSSLSSSIFFFFFCFFFSAPSNLFFFVISVFFLLLSCSPRSYTSLSFPSNTSSFLSLSSTSIFFLEYTFSLLPPFHDFYPNEPRFFANSRS